MTKKKKKNCEQICNSAAVENFSKLYAYVLDEWIIFTVFCNVQWAHTFVDYRANGCSAGLTQINIQQNFQRGSKKLSKPCLSQKHLNFK